jgi:hypothetical protein
MTRYVSVLAGWYKFACDDDIRLEGVADWSALIYDRNRDLPREGNAHIYQLVAQALLVYGFSNRPGPVWRCTSIASPITRSVNDRARSISLSP